MGIADSHRRAIYIERRRVRDDQDSSIHWQLSPDRNRRVASVASIYNTFLTPSLSAIALMDHEIRHCNDYSSDADTEWQGFTWDEQLWSDVPQHFPSYDDRMP